MKIDKLADRLDRLFADTNKYDDNTKYNQLVPEIKSINPQLIKKLNSIEVGKVSDDIAASMDFSEPIEVSIYHSGEIVCQDGHHRLAAAKQLGMKFINVEVRAINAYGKVINELIKNQL